ncbi:hypothetical protein HHI36_005536 [Cryptolaemus montrouzieri]|uniref:Uncharacterized protein n=1 Tax=Cryptolaemus montrouzieri TaxID=559131 RepID=A0ABD2NUQ2_9CUCU
MDDYRPLTEEGFQHSHCILADLQWEFVDDLNLTAGMCFEIFHDRLLKDFQADFPLVKVRRKTDSGVRWFTDEFRKTRSEVELLNEMFILYPSDEIKSDRNNLRNEYRQ